MSAALLAAAALADLDVTGNTPRYTTWFGTFSTARHATVRNVFSKLSDGQFAANTYDCSTCTAAGPPGYVHPAAEGNQSSRYKPQRADIANKEGESGQLEVRKFVFGLVHQRSGSIQAKISCGEEQ
jgi:hypothetical protein